MYKVALIYDSPDWAFHHIAMQVATHSTPEIEFTLIPSGNPRSWRAFHANILGEFDWYHYFWRGAVESLAGGHVTNISTAVYDHQFLDNLRYTNRLLSHVPFYVASERLRQQYAALFPTREIMACSDGVDTDFFYPSELPGKHPKLRLGWVGNSTWGHNSNKGFHEIFAKSVDRAQSLGLPVESVIADVSIARRTHIQMADFYQEIDVLCCTSLTEGTPNPILEASAAGRAWISTDVGIVPELAGPAQREFIVPRSVNSFVEAIERLAFNRSLIATLGAENRATVSSNWKWSDRAPAIIKFIETSISASRTSH